MYKIYIAALVVVLLAAGAWFFFIAENGESGTPPPDESGPAAVVNGEEISRADLETTRTRIAASQGVGATTLDTDAQAQLEEQALDTLIAQALLRQAAAASAISVSDAEVSTQLDAIRGQFEDEAAFQTALSVQGFTMEDLRAQIEQELAADAYLEQEIDFSALTATDAEVEQAYENSVAGVEDAPELEAIRDQLRELIVQQKRQALVAEHVQSLRAEADIEILL